MEKSMETNFIIFKSYKDFGAVENALMSLIVGFHNSGNRINFTNYYASIEIGTSEKHITRSISKFVEEGYIKTFFDGRRRYITLVKEPQRSKRVRQEDTIDKVSVDKVSVDHTQDVQTEQTKFNKTRQDEYSPYPRRPGRTDIVSSNNIDNIIDNNIADIIANNIEDNIIDVIEQKVIEREVIKHGSSIMKKSLESLEPSSNTSRYKRKLSPTEKEKYEDLKSKLIQEGMSEELAHQFAIDAL